MADNYFYNLLVFLFTTEKRELIKILFFMEQSYY